MSKQKIEAEVLTKLGGILKGLGKGFMDFLSKGYDYGFKILKENVVEPDPNDEKTKFGGGAITLENLSDKLTADIYFTYTDDTKKKANVKITPKGKASNEFKNVPVNEMEKTVQDFLVKSKWDMGQEATDPEGTATTATRKVKVCLQKVVGTREDSINLTKIQANYDVVSAISDLESILDDDAFVDTLTEAPSYFEISDNGSTYEVDVINAFDAYPDYGGMMLAAVELWGNLKSIHWNAKGESFFTLHEKLDTYMDHVQDDIDLLGELQAEFDVSAANPLVSTESQELVWHTYGFNLKEGFKYAIGAARKFVAVLEANYVNCPHDVQSELDDVIRSWTKEANYKMYRAEIE
jgi:hypothetical protein